MEVGGFHPLVGPGVGDEEVLTRLGNPCHENDYCDWDGTSVDSQFVPQGLPASPYETRVFGTGETLDPRSQTDTNMDAMYQSEIILGYARTLDNGSEIGIKGVYRNLEKTIEDVAIDFAVIEHYDAVGWDTSVNAGDAFDPDDPFNTGCGAPDSESPNTRVRRYVEFQRFVHLGAQLG